MGCPHGRKQWYTCLPIVIGARMLRGECLEQMLAAECLGQMLRAGFNRNILGRLGLSGYSQHISQIAGQVDMTKAMQNTL